MGLEALRGPPVPQDEGHLAGVARQPLADEPTSGGTVGAVEDRGDLLPGLRLLRSPLLDPLGLHLGPLGQSGGGEVGADGPLQGREGRVPGLVGRDPLRLRHRIVLPALPGATRVRRRDHLHRPRGAGHGNLRRRGNRTTNTVTWYNKLYLIYCTLYVFMTMPEEGFPSPGSRGASDLMLTLGATDAEPVGPVDCGGLVGGLLVQ